jgi:hypothetical protein
MTHFKNYNNTIDTLKQLGDNQYQIKTVTTGDIFEIPPPFFFSISINAHQSCKRSSTK